VPREVLIIDVLPKTLTGKILRRDLKSAARG
jgi:acyl-coenzyme A synthetase/AMP-(fatty) acid ligase